MERVPVQEGDWEIVGKVEAKNRERVKGMGPVEEETKDKLEYR